MLKKLKISNFAIIDNIELDIDNGFNVFTGQTGAGKSLIIDSISLLFGARSDSYMIREGCSFAYIFGLFSCSKEVFDKINLDIDESSYLIIERYIYKNKSIIKINNKNITLSKLNQIASLLGNVCSQSDTFKLYNKENYLSLFLPINEEKHNLLLNEYLDKRNSYLNTLKKLNDLESKKSTRIKDLAYANYAYEDISKFGLMEGELDKVVEEINELKNYDKYYETLNEIYNQLNGETFNIDLLSSLNNKLGKINSNDNKLLSISSNLESSYILLCEVISETKNKLENLSFDPEQLNKLNQRENDIKNLMLKYNKSFDELLKYQKELELVINNNEDYDKLILDYELLVKESFNNVIENSKKLTTYRKQVASQFEKEIINLANQLELKDIKFVVDFKNTEISDYKNPSVFLDTGTDIIDFCVNFNKEDTLLPISLVASGGELSRLMLAFKLNMLKNIKDFSLVLDEIDTGVSGLQSKRIAEVLDKYSVNNQILVITHNPIIASTADTHYLIEKTCQNDKVVSNIHKLSSDERIKEIALMLEGEVSDTSIKEALNLLKKRHQKI